jgi:hypothetical protein
MLFAASNLSHRWAGAPRPREHVETDGGVTRLGNLTHIRRIEGVHVDNCMIYVSVYLLDGAVKPTVDSELLGFGIFPLSRILITRKRRFEN